MGASRTRGLSLLPPFTSTRMIVTIDGPAGTGKSTAARGLAERLRFEFLDTGAMYRAVAVRCLQQGIDPQDEQGAAAIAAASPIMFDRGRTFVGGEEVTHLLRTPEATAAASVVAQNRRVREALVKQQRRLAEGRDIVCEGRDQGTVVFPHAECKFFLTADARIRAQRRRQELAAKGEHIPLEMLLAEQNERDQRDQNRSVAPLRAAEDAMTIDTSGLDAAAVIDLLEAHVRRRQEAGGRSQESTAS